MTFEEYQKKSKETAIYPEKHNITYPTLGLCGEAGEIAEKIKKVLRDKEDVIDEETREEILKELGDVLWYVAQIATELKLSLEGVASNNIQKLSSRKERNKLQGSGDNR